MANVVLSMDGRKEVHDYMRPFRNGKGSYDVIVPKFQKFAESRTSGKILCERYLYTTTIWIFQTMSCIWQTLDSNRYRLNLLLLREEPYAIRKKIFQSCLKNMITLQKR